MRNNRELGTEQHFKGQSPAMGRVVSGERKRQGDKCRPQRKDNSSLHIAILEESATD